MEELEENVMEGTVPLDGEASTSTFFEVNLHLNLLAKLLSIAIIAKL